jgi:hypothetical protein
MRVAATVIQAAFRPRGREFMVALWRGYSRVEVASITSCHLPSGPRTDHVDEYDFFPFCFIT